MGKNKHKNRPFASKIPAHPPVVKPTPVTTQSSEAAIASIEADSKFAMDAATEADIENATSTPATAEKPLLQTHADLIAAAMLVHETLDLCTRRDVRLSKLQADLVEREQRAIDREALIEVSQRELESERQRVQSANAQAQQVERNLLTRELNAEAGFAAERRESLRQLEVEAASLREELSKGRTQIAKERADWDAHWRAEDQRIRNEQDQLLLAHQQALVEMERSSSEKLRADRDALLRERAELKKLAAQIEEDRSILSEDREAFDTRVARKSAALLEEAKAKHQDLNARLTNAREERDSLYEQLRRRDEAERALGNRSLEETKREIDALVRERDSLKVELAKRPNLDATARLEGLERAQEEWEAERARLTQEYMATKAALGRSSIAVTEIETLRDQKTALESGRDLLHAALDELRKDVDQRIRRADGVSPFPGCSDMDTNTELQTQTALTDEIPDLAAFCSDLQQRIAIDPNPDKVLFYDLSDIRCFLGGMAMSRLHLLQGISGTGKTSLPLAAARALGAGSTLIEVQAGWRDRQDLIGYFNTFERRFYETEFLQALYRAQCPQYANRIYVVVLDEMNLSHPEQYFADLLSALEQDSHLQKLDLMTAPVEPAPALLRNGRTLAIPPNVWFVGTANHDETTKDFADKTYDRAHVMELPRDHKPFPLNQRQSRRPISLDGLRSAFKRARVTHAKVAEDAYDSLVRSFAVVLEDHFQVGWGNRLKRQMLDYVPVIIAAGGTVGEAVDHILATKLLRKVRDRHDTRPEDLHALRAQFEKWPLLDKKTATRSKKIIDSELRRLGADE